MCFYVHNKHPHVLVAKRDIVCYKKGEIQNLLTMGQVFVPPYYRFRYEFGKQYKTKTTWQTHPGWTLTVVHEGFHSYSNKKEALKERGSVYVVVVKCIIPKGSEYFYNPYYKQYVSDSIIVTNETVKW